MLFMRRTSKYFHVLFKNKKWSYWSRSS